MIFDTLQQARDYHEANPLKWGETYSALRLSAREKKITHHDVMTFFWLEWKNKINREVSAWDNGTLLSQQRLSFQNWLDVYQATIDSEREQLNELIAILDGFNIKDPNMPKRLQSMKAFYIARCCVSWGGRQDIKQSNEYNKAMDNYSFLKNRFGWNW